MNMWWVYANVQLFCMCTPTHGKVVKQTRARARAHTHTHTQLGHGQSVRAPRCTCRSRVR